MNFLANLASSGISITLEQQSALKHSLPLKKAESGVANLAIWGKITSSNGSDYLIAKGTGDAKFTSFDGDLEQETKTFYSQDGSTWTDLTDIAEDRLQWVSTLSNTLSGDPSAIYPVAEPVAEVPEAAEDDEAEPTPEVEPVVYDITELERLKYIVDDITKSTDVMPEGAYIRTASNDIVLNQTFNGIAYPDKLESYLHFAGAGKSGSSLADDTRGTWSLSSDKFTGNTTIRSLLYPGFAFNYNGGDKSWGGFYQGAGARNNDILFML